MHDRIRAAAMAQYIEGYFNHMEATDAERIAICTTLCYVVCERRSLPIEEAVKEYESGLREAAARYLKQLN